jgi:hypothetical protein
MSWCTVRGTFSFLRTWTFSRFDLGGLEQIVGETELLEDSPRSGPYADAGAELSELRGGFVDVDLDV